MRPIFFMRLTLDLLAAVLLIAGLAYWGTGNLAHELMGAGMFLLLITHNIFNRAWYGTIATSIRLRRGLGGKALNLSLLLLMIILLVTSVMISQSLSTFVPQAGGTIARDVHILVAYWALVIVGLHVGLQWTTVLNAVRRLLGITRDSAVRTFVLRILALAVFCYGVESSFVMAMGTRLSARISLDFYWDFEADTLGFLARNMAIVGTYACIGHYAKKFLRQRRRARRELA
ncbi:DUF4405 domain-containing protein [Rhizobium sp. 2MFCol3.1]|uniref:DUF4405 domain-containing protein n=1 Tax=Rhizobium sp. 2MFCol3.1 TaxID=1246459 RepID=UPI000364AC99|nr:DUF4405 domain-containing protein [Rhizobium sp. 2MFCol3.1]